MKKSSSSDKGSGTSLKKDAAGEAAVTQKEENVGKDAESLVRKDADEIDEEEEEPVPPLTSSSSDNAYKVLPLDSETTRALDTAESAMTKIQGSAHEGTGTSISSQIKKIIARELSTPAKRGKIDLQSVPLKEYLEQTVIPIVHQGLLALARERPNSPIEYLAAYFLKHKQRYQIDQQTLYNMEQDKSYETTTSSGNATQATGAEQSQPGINEIAPVQT